LKTPARIVFYDGHCALCNTTVRLLARLDRQGRLHYAPQQGSTAQRLLGDRPRELDALIYWREGQPPVDSSSAILTIVGDMGWPWRAASVLLWVPESLRNWAYQALASRRYRLFGRYESCPVPEAGTRERFLA